MTDQTSDRPNFVAASIAYRLFRFRNGDRVGLDVSDDIGAVYYIADTQELDGIPNLPALKAFPSVKQLVHASFNDDEIFPESYVEALSLLK